ncbi:MAG: hypothetical protein ACTSV3_00835 [Candidatus Thorarchaeota archaeon]|nr:MAG: hypothetical protein DRP09_04425 [Candidatus Thorarchaeota archaeon]RLI59735.1 MAG: hypothetical protein DRO87_02000 [Candidatus Thorarchaeota archaeon]
MQKFSDIDSAQEVGRALARRGRFPAIYRNHVGEYFVVEKGEWPPEKSSPILKWDGVDWIPILVKLDNLEEALEATDLFMLLGHDPVIVEFPRITFDIFLKMSHVPGGAWVFSVSDSDFAVKYMTPPGGLDEEDEDILLHDVTYV